MLAGRQGRKIRSADVFYSWKRMANDKLQPNGWWLYENSIVGFDEFKRAQSAAVEGGGEFDYDAEIAGMRVIDDRHFEVELTEPVQRFLYVLAMFQTSVVPREAAEHYGDTFPRNPVGTGPYKMERWEPAKSLILVRNPTYREELYPSEYSPDYVDASFVEDAGRRLPLADRVVITMFVEEQPMWLQFRDGKVDWTQTPAENYEEGFNKRTGEVSRDLKREGVQGHHVPLLDFIFRGFNMEDPVLGGFEPKKRALREAIAYAIDLEEINDTFYNGIEQLYDGMVPPGLDGFPKDGLEPSYYKLDLEMARQKLAEAGYPGGEGLPTLEISLSRGGNSPEQAEMLIRQLAEVGIKLEKRLLDFSQLMEVIDTKQAQMFSYAWGSDYPDAENNLALFYGPNESPGNNSFNYKRPEFDGMYERMRVMPAGPERTKLIAEMRDMVMADVPFAGSQARNRHYLNHRWLKNFKPNEIFYNWIKYLDVDTGERGR